MMHRAATLTTALAFLLCLCSVAAADPVIASSPEAARTSLGFRVGGYGFRNTEHLEKGRWDDCRMDGAGVFAQRTFGEHLFAEAAVDLYSAKNPEGMDRVSGLTTVAAGARTVFGRFAPYLQLGAGLEATRVRLAHAEDEALAPLAFFGAGLDVRIFRGLHGGAMFRTNVMKHYVHGDADGGGLESEYEAANQGQFFLRYEL